VFAAIPQLCSHLSPRHTDVMPAPHTYEHARARNPILVIEDDRDIRESLAEALQDEGYEVDTAADALEALAGLQRGWDKPR
jgi:PleD family two-component response regulator